MYWQLRIREFPKESLMSRATPGNNERVGQVLNLSYPGRVGQVENLSYPFRRD
jgi:hypothetical protein